MDYIPDTVAQTWNKPIEATGELPDSADVVIVGGGIVGISTAMFLAQQGVSVVVCEKGHIAGEQSGRNWGWVRTSLRDSREIPLMQESLRIWENLAETVGEDIGYTRQGLLIGAREQKELDDLSEWLPVGEHFGVDTQIIDARELERMVAGASEHWVGALYSPHDGRAEPHLVTAAIARAAQRLGADIATGCAVRGIETEAGRVSAVVTERGSIRTSTVLCAAGAWSSMLCRSIGITFPQLLVKGTVARLAPGPTVLEGDFYDRKLGIRRRHDGGYTVAHGFALLHPITPSSFRFAAKFLPALMSEFGKVWPTIGKEFVDELRTPSQWRMHRSSPFENNRVLDPVPSQWQLKLIRKHIDTLFPQLADTPICESWAGMVDTTPDVVPVMCECDDVPGFYLASGFSGHGFGIGPGAGKAAAAMVTNNESEIDLSEFRLSRFFDGSPIEIESTV